MYAEDHHEADHLPRPPADAEAQPPAEIAAQSSAGALPLQPAETMARTPSDSPVEVPFELTDQPLTDQPASAPAESELVPQAPAELPTSELAPAAEGQAHQSEQTSASDRLNVCFHCGSELAYPLDWAEEGPRHWRIILRCPECESRREGVFEQRAVERLDDELDRAAGALLGDLRQMTHANMSEEVEFFVRALDADLIVPSDF